MPFTGIYCPHEEGTCCNKRIKQKPGTSSCLVRLFRPWMSPATPPQPSIALTAGGGSARLMPRMMPGTLAFSSRPTKGARPSHLHPPAMSQANYSSGTRQPQTGRVLQLNFPAGSSAQVQFFKNTERVTALDLWKDERDAPIIAPSRWFPRVIPGASWPSRPSA